MRSRTKHMIEWSYTFGNTQDTCTCNCDFTSTNSFKIIEMMMIIKRFQSISNYYDIR